MMKLRGPKAALPPAFVPHSFSTLFRAPCCNSLPVFAQARSLLNKPLKARRMSSDSAGRPFSQAFQRAGHDGQRSQSLEAKRREDGAHCRAQEDNRIQETASSKPSQGWQEVALYLFGLGVLLGPPLDGIHSRVQLQIYERGALDIAGLQTNIWVFPMLGLFYSVAGVLQLVLDKYLAPNGRTPNASLQKVILSLMSHKVQDYLSTLTLDLGEVPRGLTVLLEVSAELYKAGVPFNIEAYILFALAEVNWLVFDNTWWGFALATLAGVICPLAEIPINKSFGLWHYPKGNIEIFGESTVTWVIACYFFYTPFISNLARWLSSVVRNEPQKSLD